MPERPMILGVIPARGGSRGIPGKNMIDLGGRPLLDYTLALAASCRRLDRIILTTDMPDAIAWTRRHYPRIETPFVRPARLCGRGVTQDAVVLHAVDFVEKSDRCRVDAVALLQPTCPFRRPADLAAGIRLFLRGKVSNLVGVSRVMHHPGDYVHGPTKGPFRHVFRRRHWRQRQDYPAVWFVTGALYICRTEYLRRYRRFYDTRSRLFPMAEETMIDIDTPFDLALARGLLANGGWHD